jgi:hypothetical protein
MAAETGVSGHAGEESDHDFGRRDWKRQDHTGLRHDLRLFLFSFKSTHGRNYKDSFS